MNKDQEPIPFPAEDSNTPRFVSREELGLPPRKPEPDEEQVVDFISGEHYLPGHICIGVQITHPDVPQASPERCAVILGDNPEGKETRKTFVAKLRLLADAIEKGKGGVFGDQMLTGRELNYEQMKPVLERREEQDVHDGDYLPAGYREWSIQALRALDKITKSRPVCLK